MLEKRYRSQEPYYSIVLCSSFHEKNKNLALNHFTLTKNSEEKKKHRNESEESFALSSTNTIYLNIYH